MTRLPNCARGGTGRGRVRGARPESGDFPEGGTYGQHNNGGLERIDGDDLAPEEEATLAAVGRLQRLGEPPAAVAPGVVAARTAGPAAVRCGGVTGGGDGGIVVTCTRRDVALGRGLLDEAGGYVRHLPLFLEQRGEPLTIGGTVYPTAHEPTDCDGVSVTGATVVVTDANNKVQTLTVNSVGNFQSSASVAAPYKASVVYKGTTLSMITAQTSGDQPCHTVDGANAPGRDAAKRNIPMRIDRTMVLYGLLLPVHSPWGASPPPPRVIRRPQRRRALVGAPATTSRSGPSPTEMASWRSASCAERSCWSTSGNLLRAVCSRSRSCRTSRSARYAKSGLKVVGISEDEGDDKELFPPRERARSEVHAGVGRGLVDSPGVRAEDQRRRSSSTCTVSFATPTSATTTAKRSRSRGRSGTFSRSSASSFTPAR